MGAAWSTTDGTAASDKRTAATPPRSPALAARTQQAAGGHTDHMTTSHPGGIDPAAIEAMSPMVRGITGISTCP